MCAGTTGIKNKKINKKGRRGPPAAKRSKGDECDDDDDDDDNDSDAQTAYLMTWDTRNLDKHLLLTDEIHSDDVNHVVFDHTTPSNSRVLSCADMASCA